MRRYLVSQLYSVAQSCVMGMTTNRVRCTVQPGLWPHEYVHQDVNCYERGTISNRYSPGFRLADFALTPVRSSRERAPTAVVALALRAFCARRSLRETNTQTKEQLVDLYLTSDFTKCLTLCTTFAVRAGAKYQWSCTIKHEPILETTLERFRKHNTTLLCDVMRYRPRKDTRHDAVKGIE